MRIKQVVCNSGQCLLQQTLYEYWLLLTEQVVLLWCCDFSGRHEGEDCSRRGHSKAPRSSGKKEAMVKQVWLMERGPRQRARRGLRRRPSLTDPPLDPGVPRPLLSRSLGVSPFPASCTPGLGGRSHAAGALSGITPGPLPEPGFMAPRVLSPAAWSHRSGPPRSAECSTRNASPRPSSSHPTPPRHQGCT